MNDLKEQVRRLNTRLAQDLGRVVTGQGLYKWMWSEDPALLHPMRVPDKYDFKANPESGLISAEPVYELRKMCLTADQQWLLCHWIDSPSESEWRKHFGYSLEWPRGGQYYPTTAILDAGMEPCIELTITAIDTIRQNRAVTPQEVDRRANETVAKKDAANRSRLYDQIRNDLPTWDHIEGKKDAVSYPSRGAKDNNGNDHSALSNDSLCLPA